MEFRLQNVNPAEEVRIFVYPIKDTNLLTFELFHDGKWYSSVFDGILYWFNEKVRTLTIKNVLTVYDNINLYYKRGICFKAQGFFPVHYGDTNPHWEYRAKLSKLFKLNGLWIRQQ